MASRGPVLAMLQPHVPCLYVMDHMGTGVEVHWYSTSDSEARASYCSLGSPDYNIQPPPPLEIFKVCANFETIFTIVHNFCERYHILA